MVLRSALVLAAFAALPAQAVAQSPQPLAPTTEKVIVRYAPGVDGGERADARERADVRRDEALPVARTELVVPEAGVGVGQAVQALERDPDVLYAEPDARRAAFARPNDPYFGLQWGLASTGQLANGRTGLAGVDIAAPAAWELTTGSRDVVVGVIDSGAQLSHPDLEPNEWQNPGEAGPLATNGVDDDGDGYVDDVHGWDFVAGDAQPDDGNGHGTHVAGTVGARGNDGVGVSGVAWQSSLMVLRALDANGSGSVSNAMKAYAYAARKGARVVNLSFGGASPSQAERDALAAAGDVLFVAAAGNDGADNDTTASFPCSYDLPNVLCVAASDRNDALAGFSNYGASKVDLAAPGVDIASTYMNGGYAYLSGTSMAAPHVTGVAALVLARRPELTTGQLRATLLDTVDPIPALAGRVATGGRINAARALSAPGPGPTSATEPAPAPSPAAAPAPLPEPVPIPAPTPEPAPLPKPGVESLAPAKLTVERAEVKKGRLDVLATITSRATGKLAVRFSNNGTTTRFTVPIPVGSRQVRISRKLSAKARRGATGILSIDYAGSDRVRADKVRLRAAPRPARLRRDVAEIDREGALRVAGRLTGRARGVVRIRLRYLDAQERVQTLSYRAGIDDGVWTIDEPLPAAAQRTGGQLSIQFTGYDELRIRGEQDAKAVAGQG